MSIRKNNATAATRISASSAELALRLCAPLLWMGIVCWLSLTPSPPQIPGAFGWDKLQHAGAYGLLTVLILQLFIYLKFVPGQACWTAGLIAVGYGALMEVLQLLVHTGRVAEWLDLVADAVGALLAGILFLLYHANAQHREKKPKNSTST